MAPCRDRRSTWIRWARRTWSARKVTLDFGADSVRTTIDSAGQQRKVSRAMAKGTVPTFMTGFGASYGLYSSMGLYELLLAAREAGGQ